MSEIITYLIGGYMLNHLAIQNDVDFYFKNTPENNYRITRWLKNNSEITIPGWYIVEEKIFLQPNKELKIDLNLYQDEPLNFDQAYEIVRNNNYDFSMYLTNGSNEWRENGYYLDVIVNHIFPDKIKQYHNCYNTDKFCDFINELFNKIHCKIEFISDEEVLITNKHNVKLNAYYDEIEKAA